MFYLKKSESPKITQHKQEKQRLMFEVFEKGGGIDIVNERMTNVEQPFMKMQKDRDRFFVSLELYKYIIYNI